MPTTKYMIYAFLACLVFEERVLAGTSFEHQVLNRKIIFEQMKGKFLSKSELNTYLEDVDQILKTIDRQFNSEKTFKTLFSFIEKTLLKI